MKKKSFSIKIVISWILGLIVLCLGILNLVLIHPVPGGVLIFLSLLFFPPIEGIFQRNLGFSIPLFVLVVLAIMIFWFTLGVSDLGEMYGF